MTNTDRKCVLVVDDDTWVVKMVKSTLEKRGHYVVTASDGERGLRAALEHSPDLVISDVMMPNLDGWAFVKQLRARPEFAFVPVIFLSALSSDEDRIRGFQLGADDYLPKPFRFEELDLRVTNALKQKAQLETVTREKARDAKPARKASLSGSMGDIGLSSLLTILEMERKSGVLVVSQPEQNMSGRLFFREGHVIDACIDHQEEPKHQEAVYELLTWRDGQFEFSATDVDMDDRIAMKTTSLLLEGARRIDEAS